MVASSSHVATDAPYSKWQCRIMYYWYKKNKDLPDSEMGGFTRILHSGNPDNLMDEIPTFVVDPLTAGLDRGAMQCPNCRKVEKGCWLYANDSNWPVPAYNIDDWATEWNPNEEPYDIAFPELPMRVHWCPYAGITRVQ